MKTYLRSSAKKSLLKTSFMNLYPCSCWMSDVSYNWIYKIPCIGSVIANFFFLVAIVLILVSKLHTDVSDRAAMVKTTKAIGERASVLLAFEVAIRTE